MDKIKDTCKKCNKKKRNMYNMICPGCQLKIDRDKKLKEIKRLEKKARRDKGFYKEAMTTENPNLLKLKSIFGENKE